MLSEMNIECSYKNNAKLLDEFHCQCIIKNQVIPKDVKLNFIGDHKYGKPNDDVTYIMFKNCSMAAVPKGLMQIFPKLKILWIHNSKLPNLIKEDLTEYRNIKAIFCDSNELEFLPGDLFDGFENLEWISFFGNKLKIIEPNILDGHNNLKLVKFNNNPNYDRYYSIYSVHDSKDSLEDVKNELYKNYFKNYLEKLRFSSQKGLFGDLKAFIEDDNTKDFTIQIDDQEFLVHKMLLVIRSPVLAEILRNNPEAANLKLNDIPVDVFEIMLKFLYTDELPNENETNFVQLFVAANRLQIKELKNYASGKISSQISETNALDILSLSNKYDQNELRQKSFEEIKKKYPKIEFKDEWASNPEKVAKIIEGFKKMEEGMRKLEDEFKGLVAEN